MELDSCRALKEELKSELLARPPHPPRPRLLDALAARLRGAGAETGHAVLDALVLRRTRAAPTRPPVALGIARGKGAGYVLAIRVQDKRLVDGTVVSELRDRARGEVDVRYIGRPVPLADVPWHRTRARPLRVGASVGSQPQRTTGTIGGFVRPTGGGPLHALSNAHVLAGFGKGKEGDAIVQPGWDDKGRRDEARVGTLAESVRLTSDAMNEVDCATALLDDGLSPPVGTVTAAAEADVDEIVVKEGRTTGQTTGRVLAIEAGPIAFDYPKPLGTLDFDGVMEVDGMDDTKFARRGDSGSLVLTNDGRPLGLLYAVTDVGGRNRQGIAYVCPLATVLERLEMELLT